MSESLPTPSPISAAGPTGNPVETPTARRPLGLIVPTLVLIVYWGVTEASYTFEMGMFYRFVTRMIALLLLLLFFLVWGFTRRHFTFATRWLAFAIVMATMFVAGAVGHSSTGIPATAMMGLPMVMTLSTLWLWWARRGSVRLELAGIAASSVLVFGVISLLRWDGLDGRQRAELSWRWTPNPEEKFLHQAEQQAAAPPAAIERPPLKATAADWVSFRGGDREGVVRGVDLGDWSASPPKEVWRRRVGPGWSSVIAIDDFLFTQEQRGDREAVVCYEAQTGKEVWVHTPKDLADRFGDTLSGTGPRATPTFHENRLYAYGTKGNLECLDASNGQPIWSQSLFTLTGAAVPQWGAATSPSVADDKLIVFTGGQQKNSLIALDLLTGEVVWQSPGGKVSYSTPQVMTIDGNRQIVMHDDAGLSGIRIDDGGVLWHLESPNAGSFQPMLQPHQLADDRLLVNWDSGILCLNIHQEGTLWRVDELWTSNRIKPSFNDFVIHDAHIYGLDDGIFCCVDLKGKRNWKGGRYGFGQLLLLPEINEILVLSEQGEIIRVAADPKELRELGRVKAIEGKTWNHPILAHGRLIVRNGEEMACFEFSPSPAIADAESE